MCGFLASQGLKVSESRVREALRAARPDYHQMRVTRTANSLNPRPYTAEYFGEKLHIDQNEKLVMYGVTHICAVDGYSGKIVGFISMPIKNTVEIYKHLLRYVKQFIHLSMTLQYHCYRPILVDYGLFDQIRVDHGREWTLCLFVQELLAHLRHNVEKPPHRQTTSTLVIL